MPNTLQYLSEDAKRKLLVFMNGLPRPEKYSHDLNVYTGVPRRIATYFTWYKEGNTLTMGQLENFSLNPNWDNGFISFLHAAIFLNDKDLVRELCEKKINVNFFEKNETGTYPLQFANRLKYFDISAILLRYGANPAPKNYSALNPTSCAIRPKLEDLPKTSQQSIIQILESYGLKRSEISLSHSIDNDLPCLARISLPALHLAPGPYLLLHAIYQNDERLVEDLCAAGIDMKKFSRPSLQLACYYGRPKIALILLDYGANPLDIQSEHLAYVIDQPFKQPLTFIWGAWQKCCGRPVDYSLTAELIEIYQSAYTASPQPR